MEPPIEPDDAWDAGAMGCGELVFELMVRLRVMRPGQILKLTATDLGAPHDLPAWCRMTGNRLVKAEPPCYFIERRES